MTRRRSARSGSWSGADRYPNDACAETVFNVQVEEVGGAFFMERDDDGEEAQAEARAEVTIDLQKPQRR